MSTYQTPSAFFQAVFTELFGFEPMQWQTRMFNDFISGQFPDVCVLPTGAGKTMIIPIWLSALAWERMSAAPSRLPRRLVMAINRRAVVDQTSQLCYDLRDSIEKKTSPGITQMRNALQSFAVMPNVPVFGVGTLRGELADHGEWMLDPCRPSVIVGTIDMLGSRLIFRGYGDNVRKRPLYAGLLGHDVLFVLDEAHLAPAFDVLLRAIERLASTSGCPMRRPFKAISLTASPLPVLTQDRRVFNLSDKDVSADPVLRARIHAPKHGVLKIVEEKLEKQVVAEALRYKDARERVLIYLDSPTSVREVAEAIGRGHAPRFVLALTGTIRGHERDALLSSPVYQAFRTGANVDQTVYFVTNAAGEVGIDIDATVLLCDVQPAERMIQRLGRLNRRGNGKGRAVIFVDNDVSGVASCASGDLKRAAQHSPDQSTIDLSPTALNSIFSPESFSPLPIIRNVDANIADRWAATTVDDDTMPHLYLHGINADESNPPETFVAWRAELDVANAWLAQQQVTPEFVAERLEAWFDAMPIRAVERLRDITERVHATIKRMLQRRSTIASMYAAVIHPNGAVTLHTLKKIAEFEKEQLQYRTIVLPTGASGLDSRGLLNPNTYLAVQDVAEPSDLPRRFIIRQDPEDGAWFVAPLVASLAETSSTEPSQRNIIVDSMTETVPCGAVLARQAKRALTRGYQRAIQDYLVLAPPIPESIDDESLASPMDALLLVTWAGQPKNQANVGDEEQPQLLDAHHKLVKEWALAMARSLGLPEEEKHSLLLAAEHHDRGKAHQIWQRAALNLDFPKSPAWAKPVSGFSSDELQGYRHELRSVVDAQQADVCDDLALHLIASHHGWARPVFNTRAAKQEYGIENQTLIDVAMRFDRLTHHYGWWTLAWLESLLRLADARASEGLQPIVSHVA